MFGKPRAIKLDDSICAKCRKSSDGNCVQCDECTNWTHGECMGYSEEETHFLRNSKNLLFFCNGCLPEVPFTNLQLDREGQGKRADDIYLSPVNVDGVPHEKREWPFNIEDRVRKGKFTKMTDNLYTCSFDSTGAGSVDGARRNEKEKRKEKYQTGRKLKNLFVKYDEAGSNVSHGPKYTNINIMKELFSYQDLEEELGPLQKTCHEMLRRVFQMNLDKEENIIFSPVSAYLLLNLIAMGANGHTGKDLLRKLFYKSDLLSLQKTVLHLMRMLVNDHAMSMECFTALFVTKDVNVAEQFERTLRTQFDGSIEKLDGGAAKKVKIGPVGEVNKWISEVTASDDCTVRGQIPPSCKTAFVQVSFLTFLWETEFPAARTRWNQFTGLNDKRFKVQYAGTQDKFRYLDCTEEGFLLAFFPFHTEVYGNEWELAVFFPPDVSSCMKTLKGISHFMKAKQIRRLRKKATFQDLDVQLPMFSIDNDVDLLKIVKTFRVDLGDKSANLSGISDSTIPLDILWQKSSIAIGEQGIAAASTLPANLITPDETTSDAKATFFGANQMEFPGMTGFRVTSPFAFSIFQPHAGLVLCAGIVYDPLELLHQMATVDEKK